MISKDDNVIELLIEEFSKTIQLFGLTPLEARLFTYLYLSTKANTLDEMSEALGKSKTAISTNIRSLVNMNLVKKVWKKGIRKDLYEAHKDLYKIFMSYYVTKFITEMTQNNDSLEEIRNVLMRKNTKDVETSLHHNLESKLNHMIDFHSLLEVRLKQLIKED